MKKFTIIFRSGGKIELECRGIQIETDYYSDKILSIKVFESNINLDYINFNDVIAVISKKENI